MAGGVEGQLALALEPSHEDAIRAAAKEQRVVAMTLFVDEARPLQWRSWLKPKDEGDHRGGPWLDDFEAAVLIAAGVEYSIQA